MNKVLQVFTKEYKEETKYLEFIKKYINYIKLKSNNYDLEERIKILENKKFDSNFKVLVKKR